MRKVAAFKILKTFLNKQNKKLKKRKKTKASQVKHTHTHIVTPPADCFWFPSFYLQIPFFHSFFFYSLLFCSSLDICRALRISIKTFLPLPSFETFLFLLIVSDIFANLFLFQASKLEILRALLAVLANRFCPAYFETFIKFVISKLKTKTKQNITQNTSNEKKRKKQIKKNSLFNGSEI